MNNIISLRWPWALLATQCWFTTSQSAAVTSDLLPASSSPLPSPWRDTRCKDAMYQVPCARIPYSNKPHMVLSIKYHVQGYQVPGAKTPCTRYQILSIRCRVIQSKPVLASLTQTYLIFAFE